MARTSVPKDADFCIKQSKLLGALVPKIDIGENTGAPFDVVYNSQCLFCNSCKDLPEHRARATIRRPLAIGCRSMPELLRRRWLLELPLLPLTNSASPFNACRTLHAPTSGKPENATTNDATASALSPFRRVPSRRDALTRVAANGLKRTGTGS